MRVDAVWVAGQQGHHVLTGDDLDRVRVGRQDDLDACHAEGVGLAHGFDIEEIPDLHLGQAREHHGSEETGVRGNDGAYVVARHREAGAVHLTGARGERRFAGAVVDRQVDADLGDDDRSFDAHAFVEQTHVVLVLGRSRDAGAVPAVGAAVERVLDLAHDRLTGLVQLLVVLLRGLDGILLLGVRPLRSGRGLTGDDGVLLVL